MKVVTALITFFVSATVLASPRLLIVGDSLTAGGGTYASRLAKVYPATIIAKIGHRTDWMLGIVRVTPLSRFTHLIILGGGNDIAQGRVRGAAVSLLKIYRLAKSHGLKVIAITVPPSKGSRAWTPRRQADKIALNRWILSQRGGVVDEVVDFYSLVRDGSDSEKAARRYTWRTDYVHLNVAAHKVLFREVLKKI